MSVLSAIPLPLRIVAFLLIGIALHSLLGQGAGSLFTYLAVFLWTTVVIVLLYEFGWLNFLSRVPALSKVLGFLSNRRQITSPDSVGAAETPPGRLDAEEREAMFNSAKAELDALKGIDRARADIEQKLISPAMSNPDNPFNTQSPALVAFFHGARGSGKTTAALCAARMLVGTEALESAKVVTIKGTDLRGGMYGSATQMGLVRSEEALDGTLLIDGADWMAAASEYGDQSSAGVDLGLAILEIVNRYPRRIFIAVTLGSESAERLRQDAEHARWLGKLTLREIGFDDLDSDSLLDILSQQLDAMGKRWEDDTARTAAGRLLEELHDRHQTHFDNADACRRVAEQLVELASDPSVEQSNGRQISRAVVRQLDDQLE